VDVRDVARELGVRYVVEGSVRKAGNRVRLTAQLIDGPTGNHVWATRYDRDLEDIFAVQDELTQTLVGAIEPELSKAEQERARLKKPETLDVWDIYLRGMSALNALTSESLAEAEQTFARVIELDSGYAAAYSGLAEVHYYYLVLGLAEAPDVSRRSAFDAARRAVELDRESAIAHCTLGRAHMINRRFDESVSEFQAALEINPSNALAHYGLGATYVFDGQSEISLPHLEQAIRLSPHDAHMGSFRVRTAQAYLHLHDYEKAVEWARKALRLPNFQWSRQMILASALAQLGRTEEARSFIDELLRRIPHFSAAYMLDFSPMVENEDFRHMVDGLRQAGLPA
jgi:tetratricopeptide (TPR) repeat protein